MEILIDSRQTRIDVDPDELRKKTEKILEDLGCNASAALSIVLVGSAEMAELNLTYRGKQGPTNVLSFSQQEGAEGAPQADLLGDVVICVDVAAEDAAELGYSNEEMVLYLLIHGILHLSGYDHQRPHDATEMQVRVESIFQEIFPGPGEVPARR
jgi:probable rRNA maturation factor